MAPSRFRREKDAAALAVPVAIAVALSFAFGPERACAAVVALALLTAGALLPADRRRALLAAVPCAGLLVTALEVDRATGDIGRRFFDPSVSGSSWLRLWLIAALGVTGAGLAAVAGWRRRERGQAVLVIAACGSVSTTAAVLVQQRFAPGLGFITAMLGTMGALTLVSVARGTQSRTTLGLPALGVCSVVALALWRLNEVAMVLPSWTLTQGWMDAFELRSLLVAAGGVVAVAIAVDLSGRGDTGPGALVRGAAVALAVSVVGTLGLRFTTGGPDIAALTQCWLAAAVCGASVDVIRPRGGKPGSPRRRVEVRTIQVTLTLVHAAPFWLAEPPTPKGIAIAAVACLFAVLGMVAAALAPDFLAAPALPPLRLGRWAVVTALVVGAATVLPVERKPIGLPSLFLWAATEHGATASGPTCLVSLGRRVPATMSIDLSAGEPRFGVDLHQKVPANTIGSLADMRPCAPEDRVVALPDQRPVYVVVVQMGGGMRVARVQQRSLPVHATLTLRWSGHEQTARLVRLPDGAFAFLAQRPPH